MSTPPEPGEIGRSAACISAACELCCEGIVPICVTKCSKFFGSPGFLRESEEGRGTMGKRAKGDAAEPAAKKGKKTGGMSDESTTEGDMTAHKIFSVWLQL